MANSYSENPQFQAAVSASQVLLDQVAAPPNLQNQTSAGPPALPGVQPSPAAVRAATIAHYKRVLASCTANGISPASAMMALKELGAL
jgi:hypothetical protein